MKPIYCIISLTFAYLSKISAFYLQDSEKFLQVLSDQSDLSDSSIETTAQRVNSAIFGAKTFIQNPYRKRKEIEDVATPAESKVVKKHSLKPKVQPRLDVKEFGSNDIPFMPSEQIPLTPSLAQRHSY